MLRKLAVMLITVLFFTACEENLLMTEPVMPESPVLEESANLSQEFTGGVLFKGIGEPNKSRYLNISEIVYLNPVAYTEDEVPVFLINRPLNYELSITSVRPFRNLEITAVQEYGASGVCNRYWYPYPLVIDFTKGQSLPGSSVQVWENISLAPGETKVLTGSYTIPLEACSALGQTHLIIKNMNRGSSPIAGDSPSIIYDESEAGVFFLKAPGRRRR